MQTILWTRSGAGAGKLLVRVIERWCLERVADRVTLSSGHHRPESHKFHNAFHNALGYEATGLRFFKKLQTR
jgi:hypothetical protein